MIENNSDHLKAAKENLKHFPYSKERRLAWAKSITAIVESLLAKENDKTPNP